MDDDRWRLLDQPHAWRYAGVGCALAAIVLLAVASIWSFDETPPALGPTPSIWELLLFDRWLLGLIRAGVAIVVAYVIVSVPALIIAGRWMKGLGTTGVVADDAAGTGDVIQDYLDVAAELEWENQDLRVELDEAHRTIELLMRQVE